MIKIDAHQHFWVFDPVRDSWIDEKMAVIQRDFLPSDLLPLLQQHQVDGCITIQSDQSEEETMFQLTLADKWDFILGVVGWVDLRAEDLADRLEYYSTFKKLKGFRHVLQGEPERNFMLQPKFMKGVELLQKWGFTYDILIFPDQLKYAHEFVKAFPDQPFVIDHIAKPNIKDREIEDWKKNIFDIGSCKNVYCKVSGMVTEADWSNWKPNNFKPYLDVVTEAFGTDRIMFGSDWPVCLVASSYTSMMEIVTSYFADFSNEDRAKILGKNAIHFYKLEI